MQTFNGAQLPLFQSRMNSCASTGGGMALILTWSSSPFPAERSVPVAPGSSVHHHCVSEDRTGDG